MPLPNPRHIKALLACLAAAALAACGGGNSPQEVEAELADADPTESAQATITAQDLVPPTLNLLSPTSNRVTTNAASLAITGTVSDNVRLASVTWYNSRGGQGKATLAGAQPNLYWAIAPTLAQGQNDITITARDRMGNATKMLVSVSMALPAVVAPPAPAAPPVSLVTDKRLITIPGAGTMPAKGADITDPATNFKVRRVTDKSELTGDYGGHKSPMAAIVYSRYTPVNTTGEFVLVHGDNSTSAWVYRVSDNTPVTILRFKPSLGASSRSLGEINELRWDYSGANPYRLYFVGRSLPAAQRVATENPGMTLYQVDINPSTGVQAAPMVVRDFSADFPTFANAEIMNDVEGDSSNDSRYWAWMVMNTSLGSGYQPYGVFTYDKTNNQILGRLQRSCTGAPAPCTAINTPATAAPYMTRPNMVEMSPLGTRVVVNFDRAYAGHFDADVGALSDGPKAFLPNFTDPIRIAVDATHSGWAWGKNGEELFVSQNNRNDWIEAVDITSAATAKCTLISGNSYSCGTKLIRQTDLDGGSYTIGYHFGKIYDRSKRGWVYMNTYDSTGYSFWGKNQGLLVQVNDATLAASKVVRLGSTYNTYFDYRSEGSGALDFKAENIWTTGNWGFTDGRGEVIRIQFPAGLWSALP